jgi:hypothetical protein
MDGKWGYVAAIGLIVVMGIITIAIGLAMR